MADFTLDKKGFTPEEAHRKGGTVPTIRMKTTTEKPLRREGKLYAVPFPESWELVRDGLAEHEYVPESKLDVLTASEPKKAG